MSELEQTKKVLDVIANLINEKETCTYRHLIYDLLEFKEDAYSELISGLTITNFLVYVKEQDKEIKRLKEEYVILQNASDEVEEEKDREIERLNTNLEVANEDLTRIAKLLNLEEGCTIYDIEDKIERLNNIINKGIEAINVYQNEKTLSVGYEDLKRIRGILRGNEFDLRMFEENLQELKGSGKE